MRSKEQIEQDISTISMQAGDLQYKILAYQNHLRSMNERLGSFHQELITLETTPETKEIPPLEELTHGEV